MNGSIPPDIGNLTNLTYLNLNGNQLTGEIPPEIESLTSLTVLQLQNNQFSGEISQTICDLTNLNWVINIDLSIFEISYIFSNQFCPPYPECIEDYVGEQDTSNCP